MLFARADWLTRRWLGKCYSPPSSKNETNCLRMSLCLPKVMFWTAIYSTCVVYTKTIIHLSVRECGGYLPPLQWIVVNYHPNFGLCFSACINFFLYFAHAVTHFCFNCFFFLLILQSEFQRSSTTNQQTALRRKKKKNKKLDTTTSGIFVRRGVSSPRTIHCLDKDWRTPHQSK